MQPGHLPGGRTANLAIIGAPDSLTALLLSRRQGPSVPWGGEREIAAAPATIIPCATWRRALGQHRRHHGARRRDTSARAHQAGCPPALPGPTLPASPAAAPDTA